MNKNECHEYLSQQSLETPIKNEEIHHPQLVHRFASIKKRLPENSEIETEREEEENNSEELDQHGGADLSEEEIDGLDEMGGENMEERGIGIRCEGDGEFQIILPRTVRKYSSVIDNILDGDEDALEIKVPESHKETLLLLEQFLLHHVEVGSGETEATATGDLKLSFSDPFDYEFAQNLTCEECCGLTASAEWLDIQCLREVTGALFLCKFLGCAETDILQIFETCEWNTQTNDIKRLYCHLTQTKGELENREVKKKYEELKKKVGFVIEEEMPKNVENLSILSSKNKTEEEIFDIQIDAKEEEEAIFEIKEIEDEKFDIEKCEKLLILVAKECGKNLPIPLENVLKRLKDCTEPKMFQKDIPIGFWYELCKQCDEHFEDLLFITETEARLSLTFLQPMMTNSSLIQQINLTGTSCFAAAKGLVQYLRHHNGSFPCEIAKPIRSVKMCKIVEDPWDGDFVNSFTKSELFNFITLCVEYKVMSAVHLGCAKVATMIKGKSPEEIKQILGSP